MRKIILCLLSMLTLIGLVSFFAQFFKASNGTVLFSAGSAMANLIFTIISGTVLIAVIKNSPEAVKRRQEMRDRVQDLSESEFIEFATEELCKMLSVKKTKSEDSLRKDLRIPLPDIENTLYDFGKIYDLPISDEDISDVVSVRDIVDLIQSRRLQA